jgi:hypothetical protein
MSHLVRRVHDCGQIGRHERGGLDVVVSDERDIAWHCQPSLANRVHRADRHQIVRA